MKTDTEVRPERRATVRVFVVDEQLKVVRSSVEQATLPRGLRPTLSRLIRECKADPHALHAVAFAEARIIRVVPMSGAPVAYAVSVERYTTSRDKLLKSLDRFALSPRECDALLLALEGKTAIETAEELNIAVSTATDYLNRLQMKIGARNKSDMIAKILGWTPTSESNPFRAH